MQTYQENKGGNIDTSELATVHVGSNSDLESYILAGKYPLSDYPLGTVHVDTDNESLGIYFRFGEFDWRKVATNSQNYKNFAFKSDLLPMGNIFNQNTFINKYFGDITDTTHFRILDVLGFENYLKENRLNNCLRLSPYVCDENKMYLFKGSEKIEMPFSRTTSKSTINQFGESIQIGSNIADIQLDTDNKPFLKFEPQATNYVTDAILGDYTGSIDITNKVVSPSGLVDATTPIPTANTNRFEEIISPSTFATDDILTYSWYRKRISTPIVDTFLGDLDVKALINLTIENPTKQIESDTNGFDRFEVQFKVVDGSLESKARLYFGNIIVAGNQSVAYYGHQLELRSYATSLIYTNGTIATRTSDISSKIGLSNYINSSEGVLYAEISALANDVTRRYISLSDGGDTNNEIRLYFDTSDNTVSTLIKVGGATEMFLFATLIDVNNFNKIAVKYKEDDFALWVNGVEISTDLSGSTFTSNALDTLAFEGNGLNFYGKCKDLRVYNEALTDQELIDLTTI